MAKNALRPAYKEYKLFRSSEWDNYDFKGRLPDGKWQTIYSAFVDPELSGYAADVIESNYSVDVRNIQKVG